MSKNATIDYFVEENRKVTSSLGHVHIAKNDVFHIREINGSSAKIICENTSSPWHDKEVKYDQKFHQLFGNFVYVNGSGVTEYRDFRISALRTNVGAGRTDKPIYCYVDSARDVNGSLIVSGSDQDDGDWTGD